MKICLIGQNLTNLILASVFEEKKLNVDIYLNKKIQNIKTNRTIALSSDNFDYLKFLTKSSIPAWKSKEKDQLSGQSAATQAAKVLGFQRLRDSLYPTIDKLLESSNLLKSNGARNKNYVTRKK